MLDLNSHKHSESEEMYLVTIARLIEDGVEVPVPLSSLADKMTILPVSVNQMIRKLVKDGLVDYQPYQGVDLTPDGKRIAAHILRHRRLWEVFLVNRLDLSFSEAEALSCHLEHVTPEKIARKLSLFLGDPEINPLGKIIPRSEGDEISHVWTPISQLEVNETARIMKVETDYVMRAFLAKEGIGSGVEVIALAVGDSGIVLRKTDGHTVHLSKPVADKILAKSQGIGETSLDRKMPKN